MCPSLVTVILSIQNTQLSTCQHPVLYCAEYKTPTASPPNSFLKCLSRAPVIWPWFHFQTLLLTPPQDVCTFLFAQAFLSLSPLQLPKSSRLRPTLLTLPTHPGIPPTPLPRPTQANTSHQNPACSHRCSSINNSSAWLFPMTMAYRVQKCDQKNWVFGI